tara:strand:+ start:147 stop:1049 length:903 start_codon:yes stop_codon:yes gene_type:complete
MANILRSNISRLLVEGIKKNYGLSYEAAEKHYQKAFPTIQSNKELETYNEISSVGLHSTKAEGSEAASDTINQGVKTICVNQSYGKKLDITHEAIQDNLYGEILRAATSMGQSTADTIETICMNVLNDGFSTTLADGVVLFSASHPLEGSGGTGSNTSTAAALSEASLISMSTTVGKFTDARGNKINVKPKLLLVPVDLATTAHKLLHSTLQPGGNNNDLNVFGRTAGRIPEGYISSAYISDTNGWIVKTSVDGSGYQEREKPRIMEDFKQASMVNQIVSYFRGNAVVFDWRSFYGNAGA